MLACTFTIALFAVLPPLAAATTVPPTTTPTTPASQCNVGDLQCCNIAEEASSLDSGLETLLGLLNVISGLTGQVGATCSPIGLIGVFGNSCSAHPLCCSNNSFNGVIAFNCTPVDLNL